MSDDHITAYIRGLLKAQHDGERLTEAEHRRLIHFVDMGILGMDGFKYCWPEVAKENRRKMLEAYPWARTA